jgi:RND family efflux transporter MFP subunit
MDQHESTHLQAHGGASPPAGAKPARKYLALGLGIAVLGALIALAILPRLESKAALSKAHSELNVPTVSVIQPKAGDANEALVLPGSVQAQIETPIYARTNGYVKRRLADIGSHVKAGELLAEIDTPEVDDQLQQARADLANANANYELARKTGERWEQLRKERFVSEQGADQTRGDLRAKKAALESARFNVARLEKTLAFKHIYAPFEGVVTARNVDVGTLIDAGSSGEGRELFRLASVSRLRVQVNVPQAQSRVAVPGIEAQIKLPEAPDRVFKGKLMRTAQSIDAASRTLLAEFEVDNASGELLPGAYVQVHLKLPAGKQALVVPVNALLFRGEGVQVASVSADQRVVLKPVVLGKDFGTTIEVVSGLASADAVILNPSDSLIAGTKVRVVKQPEAQKKPPG